MGEQGLEKWENEGDLELLDLEPEVKEFVRAGSGRQREAVQKGAGHSRKPRRAGRQTHVTAAEGSSYLWMAVLLAVVVIVALCGILWLKLPIAVVLAVIILEAALAVCLRTAPLWLHGLVVLLNVVLGVVFGKIVFMLLAELVYLAETVSAYCQRKR